MDVLLQRPWPSPASRVQQSPPRPRRAGWPTWPWPSAAAQSGRPLDWLNWHQATPVDRVLPGQTPIANPRLLPRHRHRLLGRHPQNSLPRRSKPRRAASAAGPPQLSTPAPAVARLQGQDRKTIDEPCPTSRSLRPMPRLTLQPRDLGVSWRGKSIGDVSAMEVDEAVESAAIPSIASAAFEGRGFGLSPRLTFTDPSGGEAQRIKAGVELVMCATT